MEELGAHVGIEVRRPRLEQPQPKMHMAEQPSLLGRAKRRAAAELDGTPDVVQERCREKQVVTEPRMKLRRLATKRCDADRVLEESAGVAMVPVCSCSGKRSKPLLDDGITEYRTRERREPGMRDLAREELEEALQLVGVTAQPRRQLGRVGLRRRLDRANLHLEPAAEPLHAAKDSHSIAFRESSVEELDVIPDPRLDPPTRIDELEGEIRRPGLGAAAFLPADGVDPFDGAVFCKLGDAGHTPSLEPGYPRDMADVAPFRAIRYSEPTPDVTAPPYDVLTPEQRDAYRARDPHNVVHLTLNDSEEDAGRLFRAWLDEGVLVRDDAPSVWAVRQDYVGPDGVARRRDGVVVSLGVEPYSTGTVLPHERTHAGPKESRLRLLRAARAQLEPIFLLYDGEPVVSVPDRDPDLEVAGTSLWRLPSEGIAAEFVGRQLLIADGHHRYETAVAYAEQEGTPGSARMMVVLVSTSDPGLEIFPTHRLFRGHADTLPAAVGGSSLAALARLPYDHAQAVLYHGGATTLVTGEAGELDVELADRLVGHENIAYTADADEAVAKVDAGEFDGAFLLRATRIEDVFEHARRGDVMPQKTTYFFPKLTSGLLFHPV